MRNGDCRGHEGNCDGRCRDESAQAEPFSHPLGAASVLPDLSRHIAGEKWRKLGLGRVAEKVPQFLVIFTVHNCLSELSCLQLCKLRLQRTPRVVFEFGCIVETFKLPHTGCM